MAKRAPPHDYKDVEVRAKVYKVDDFSRPADDVCQGSQKR